VGDHVKMYDEELLKEIMVSTALCVHELLMDDPNVKEADICEFVETNFRQIIDETITAEIENGEERQGEDFN
jgi:hypothetical protein